MFVCVYSRARACRLEKENKKPEKTEAGGFDSLIRERPLLERKNRKKVRERSLLRTQVTVCVRARARA
jgi:hypothetical protein